MVTGLWHRKFWIKTFVFFYLKSNLGRQQAMVAEWSNLQRNSYQLLYGMR